MNKEALLGTLVETTYHHPKFYGSIHGTPLYRMNKDVNDQHARLSQLHHIDDLAEHGKMLRHIRNYTRASFDINRMLIAKRGDPLTKLFAKIDSKRLSNVISTHGKPLEEETHVYSGTGAHDPSDALSKTATFHTPGFTSTSIQPHVAYNFVRAAPYDSHVIHFKLPKGYNKGFYVGSNTYHHENEYEYVLDKNQKWKVLGHEITHPPYDDVKQVHIWTVEPHNESIHEAYEHNPNVLRSTYNDNDRTYNINKHLQDTVLKHSEDSDRHNNKLNDLQYSHNTGFGIGLTKIHQPLRDYSNSSRWLNTALIRAAAGEATVGDYQQNADTLSNHIKKHAMPLPEDGHFYSGTGLDMGRHVKVGGLFHTPAFTSASTSLITAGRFARIHFNEGDARDKHIIHFRLPKGYNKGIANGYPSHHPEENEYLLDKDQTWRVVGHKRVNNHKWPNDNLTRIHIWTVEPAEHHNGNIHESYEHNPRELSLIKRRGETVVEPVSQHDRDIANQEHISDLIISQYGIDHPNRNIQYEHEPLHWYSHTDYAKSVNHKLINDHVPGSVYDQDYIPKSVVNDRIHNISNHIRTHAKPLERDGHFYSGTSLDMKKLVGIGSTFHTPAFTSTSTSMNMSRAFGGRIGAPKLYDKHIIHFKLPKGYNKGMVLGPASRYPEEDEYLLDKDQTWRVIGHKRVNIVNFGNKSIGVSTNLGRHHIWTVEPHETSK